MAGRVILDLPNPALDSNGSPMSGATLTHYLTGTTTLADIFDSEDLDTELPNPLSADASGRFVMVWAPDSTVFDVVWKTAGGAVVRTFDNIVPLGGGMLPDGSNVDMTEEEAAAFVEAIGAASASDFPSVMAYIPQNLHADIRDNTSTDDVTAYFDTALSENDTVYVPAGTFRLVSLVVPSNKTIKTAGYATVFYQMAGTAFDARMIRPRGSNITIGDATLRGNIATDTNEFKHGIAVDATGLADPMRNVRLGSYIGEDIRGDVICIWSYDQVLEDISFGDVVANNVHRNAVSIVSGNRIRGGSIYAPQVGLFAVDFEPEPNSLPLFDVYVHSVKGGSVGFVGQDDGVVLKAVRVGTLDLDPAYTEDSDPSYSLHATYSKSGAWVRNVKDIHVGMFRANGHVHHAIQMVKEPGDSTDQHMTIDRIEWTGINTDAAAEDFYARVSGLRTFTIKGGFYTGVGTKCLIEGNSVDPGLSSATVRNVTGDGKLMQDGECCVFDNCLITNDAAHAFLRVSRSTIMGGAYDVDAVGYDCSNNTMIGVEVLSDLSPTWRSFSANAAHLNHVLINTTIDGSLTTLGLFTAQYQSTLRMGGNHLWEDSTGDLRTKTSAPSSDTDGTVVGTQS